ncbi:MAG: hypothetical protein ACOVVK_11245 [Elsteraceae bacterium]
MTIIPALILICATAALGIFLGVRRLRRGARKPMLIGLHLLLGLGALESVAYSLWRTSPDGGSTQLGATAAGALAAALFIGLIAPILGRGSQRRMNVALTAHASVAAVGLAFALVWIVSR